MSAIKNIIDALRTRMGWPDNEPVIVKARAELATLRALNDEKCKICKHFIHDDLDGLCGLTMGGAKITRPTPECSFVSINIATLRTQAEQLEPLVNALEHTMKYTGHCYSMSCHCVKCEGARETLAAARAAMNPEVPHG